MAGTPLCGSSSCLFLLIFALPAFTANIILPAINFLLQAILGFAAQIANNHYSLGACAKIWLFAGVDALRRNFDFADATEREQQLYKILWRLFRRLFHNVANSIGDRCLKHHTLGLQTS